MTKTLSLDELPGESQQLIEELLESDQPVIISRAGRPLGGVITYRSQDQPVAELTAEEEADIRLAIAQGEDDYAAGRYITIDEFKLKNAAKLQDPQD